MRGSIFVTAPLAILALPFVAVYPPLEQYGKRSGSVFVRSLNMPPVLRFCFFEGRKRCDKSHALYTSLGRPN